MPSSTIGRIFKNPQDIAKLRRPRFGEDTSYKEIRSIGHGGNGHCLLLERRSDRTLRVCKITRRFEQEDEPFEAVVLNGILPQHPRLALLHDTIIQTETFQMYYTFYPVGDLSSLIAAYSDRKALIPETFLWHCFIQLAEALAFIHYGCSEKQNPNVSVTWTSIIHGDIKPENVFLGLPNQGCHYLEGFYPSLVLGDFGSASLRPTDRVGTYMWQPPETPRTSMEADVWALGAVVYALGHKRPPIGPLPANVRDTMMNWHHWYMYPEAREFTPLDGFYSQSLNESLSMVLQFDPQVGSTSIQILFDLLLETGPGLPHYAAWEQLISPFKTNPISI